MHHSRADDYLSEGIMKSVSALPSFTPEPSRTPSSTTKTERSVKAPVAAKKLEVASKKRLCNAIQGVERLNPQFKKRRKSFKETKEMLQIHTEVAMKRVRDVAMGWMAMESGDYKKAIEHFEKWKGALLNISGEKTTIEVAESLVALGDAYQKQGMYLESMKCLEKALEVQLKELSDEHATVADTYAKLGWTCSNYGKHDKAMEYQQKGLSIRLKVHGGEDHEDVGNSHHRLGCVYNDQGKYEEALKHYEIALRIRSEKLRADHKDVASTYNNMANVYSNQGNYEEALTMYEKCLSIQLKKLGDNHPHVALTYNNMGVVNDNQGKHKKALIMYEKLPVDPIEEIRRGPSSCC